MEVQFQINDLTIPIADIYEPFVKAIVERFGDVGVDADIVKDVIELLQTIDGEQPISHATNLKLQEYATYFCALAMMKDVGKAQFYLTDEIRIDIL